MKTYLVTITKTVTTEIEVRAANEQSAENKAYKKALKGDVEFFDDFDELNVVDVEQID